MAITQSLCTSFKVNLLNGLFNFGEGTSQQFYLALYTNEADLSAATTAYTSGGEVVGTNYDAGGKRLTINQTPVSTGTTAFVNFDSLTWTSSTISARGALIYLHNGTTNPAVAVLDFGSEKASTGGDFTVTFPASNVSNAIIRIA